MNTFQTVLARPRGLRIIGRLVSFCAVASLSANAATEQVVMKLGGKQFGPGTNLIATSGAWTIQPSKLYDYKLSGAIRGKDGTLKTLVPTEVKLESFFTSINAATPAVKAVLGGIYDNPSGTLSTGKTIFNQTIKGSKVFPKPHGRVLFELNLAGKIGTNGEISLEITKATVKSAKGPAITGNLVFAKGSQLVVSTAPSVGFLAKGQGAFPETAGFASVIVWRLGNMDKPAIVTFGTVDGTAIAGADYTATTGTLTFAPGVKEMTIQVPILTNVAKTTNSKFTIVLTNPSVGTVLGKNLVNTVAITNVP